MTNLKTHARTHARGRAQGFIFACLPVLSQSGNYGVLQNETCACISFRLHR